MQQHRVRGPGRQSVASRPDLPKVVGLARRKEMPINAQDCVAALIVRRIWGQGTSLQTQLGSYQRVIRSLNTRFLPNREQDPAQQAQNALFRVAHLACDALTDGRPGW
jgi:hypothetical protein